MQPTRHEKSQGDDHEASAFGHVFMIISIPTLHGPKEQAYGFYSREALTPLAKDATLIDKARNLKSEIWGPGLVNDEFRCGVKHKCDVDENDEKDQKLLKRYSEITDSVRIPITEAQRRAIIGEIDTWNHKEYNVATQNCIDFVSAIVKKLDYPSPSRLQKPEQYLAALKKNIHEEDKRRELGRQAAMAQQKAQDEAAKKVHVSEQWSTSEGETPGHYRNTWVVTYDGSTFSCAPSPAFGNALCTATASGNTRVVQRFQASDNNLCTFNGTVSGNVVRGTYSCTIFKGPFSWFATIR
jgi:hypothetical protein